MDEGNSRIQESVDARAEARPFRHSNWFAVILLAIFCMVAYWNSLSGRFQYDDYKTIRFNLSLREGNWKNILLWAPSRPLSMLTFALNYKTSRMNPVPYHIVNLILHYTSVLLFFLLLKRMSPLPWFALVAAVLMAVHPLNTESVSYITSRFITLCAVFYLSSLLFLDSYLKKRSRSALIGFIGLFLLAALSKENAAAIPVAAGLYALLIHGKEVLLRNRLLFLSLFALTLAAAIFRVFMMIDAPVLIDSPPAHIYWATEINVWIRYLWLSIYPVSLNVEHDVAALSPTSPWFLGALVLVIAICISFGLFRKKHPILSFWGLWFFLNLIPSSVVPLNEFMAEHSTYISLFGFCACVSYLLIALAKPLAKPVALVWVVVFVLTSLYVVGTIHRNRAWKDQLSLWADAAEKSPKRVRPRLNLANAYIQDKAYEKAIHEYSLVLSYVPRSKEAFSGIGIAYLRMGAVSWAEEYFRKALAVDRDFTDARVGLALVMYENRLCDQTLVNLEPIYHERWESSEVVTVLADCYAQAGRMEDAIRVLRRVVDSGTPEGKLYAGLMEAYYVGKHPEKALEVFDNYKDRFPQFPLVQLRVAAMLKELGRSQQAQAILIGLTTDVKYGETALMMLKGLQSKSKDEKK